jgi:hypothetical protein
VSGFAHGDAGESFAWTKLRVVRGSVADLFASDGVLLVVKRESGPGDAGLCVEVIQRGVSGGDQLVANHEGDVLQVEGLRAAACVG